MNKKELVEILVNDYGYDEDDLREDGRPLTNAKLKMMIEQEKADAENLKHSKSSLSVNKAFKFKDNDLISVMNGRGGALVYRSDSTGRVWRFTKFGQTEKIPYIELLSIRNRNPKVFNEAWMLILDRDIQDEFGLIELYNKVVTPEIIDEIFNKSVDDLSKFIDSMPKGSKSAFISRAKELYENRELDSVSKIEVIQEKFGFSLEDNAPLSDIAVKAKK